MTKIEGLNDLINEALKDETFPGCTYTLVTDKESYYGCFGRKSIYDSIEENDIDTLYDMASCTKVICTTSCIMKLLEQGKIRLYDQVQKFLPNFKHENILIFDLLTHTSGLPADVHRSNTIKTREECLEKIFSIDTIYEKNSKIVYSDIGFILLGLVIEEVSKMSLDQFAKINIFDPLDMTSTGFNPKDIKRCAPTERRNDEVVQGMVRGKVHDEKAYILGGVAGHAGLFSCVRDINKFIKMVLNDGVYYGKQIFSKATLDMLFTPYVQIQNGISLDYETRGLGWIVKGTYCSAGDLCSKETILHTGFTGTNVFIDRINRVGFSLLSNRVHPTRQNIKIIPFRGRLGNYIIANFGGRNNEN